ncbi:hypothetical protein LD85_0394 [Saccharolobus islandicus L.D.8.5]|uniref:Uncharacterized protein n=1 Tax=Saccharolobus islandicus (strain L.D.8.5 / Lassen \|nr:hypothetical protein LD85_0394 [Sulfolobus islandicus L.D.8.5]
MAFLNSVDKGTSAVKSLPLTSMFNAPNKVGIKKLGQQIL